MLAVVLASMALVVSCVSAWLSYRASLTASERQRDSSRRTEHGVTMRWALEAAASSDPSLRAVGFGVLDGLLQQTELSDDESRVVADAVQALLDGWTYPEDLGALGRGRDGT